MPLDPWMALELVDTILTPLRPYRSYMFDGAVVCTAIWALLWWRRTFRRQLVRTTQLRGPPSQSFLYGVGKHVLGAEDPASIYEKWAQEYGSVYMLPWTLGRQRVMLCDPKAIAHYYAQDTWSYAHVPAEKRSFLRFVGRGLLWADGENHRRQRKALMPAFSIPATRQLTWIFYETAYKTKAAWNALIESSGGEIALIEAQTWMNHISLDTIGHAGFSLNFGALEGKRAPITEALDGFTAFNRSGEHKTLYLLWQALPFLIPVPKTRLRLIMKINVAIRGIMNTVLARARKIREMGGEAKEDKSIIGQLVSAGNDSEAHLTEEEIGGQVKALLVAGYETVSITLSWALIELSRNPEVQTRLRNELVAHGTDPTYDQFMNGLPYLDAVVHEILRIHPAVIDNERVAIKDDIIPLSEPVRTQSGTVVDSLTIARGSLVAISVECMNRSAAFWGEDAKVFRPCRWLEDGLGQNAIPAKANEIQGHRHLLTFIDGPRTCPGKNFAIIEIKVVLTVLVKNFVFELRDGINTKIEMGKGMLERPKVAGETGCKLPLHVRPYVA